MHIFKKLIVLAAITLLLFAVSACGKSDESKKDADKPVEKTEQVNKNENGQVVYETDLVEQAKHEHVWLRDIKPIIFKINKAYKSWENGKITRQQLNRELENLYEQFKPMYDNYMHYYETHRLSDAAQNDENYKLGLIHSKELHSAVNNFLYTATKGVIHKDDNENKLRELSDEQLKNAYDKYMVKKYAELEAKVEKAVKNILNN